MTNARLERLLKRVSYHGMKLSVMPGLFMGESFGDMVRLVIEMAVLDSETLKPTVVTATYNQRIEIFRSDDDFYRWVWYNVRDRAIHEAREFFKIDGVAPHHPHRDDPNRLMIAPMPESLAKEMEKHGLPDRR